MLLIEHFFSRPHEHFFSRRILAFLIVEHTLIFVKLAVEAVIPDLPLEVDKAEDKNDEYAQRIFGSGYKPVHLKKENLPVKGGIWCNPDMEACTAAKEMPTYTPFHVAGGKASPKAKAGAKKN